MFSLYQDRFQFFSSGQRYHKLLTCGLLNILKYFFMLKYIIYVFLNFPPWRLRIRSQNLYDLSLITTKPLLSQSLGMCLRFLETSVPSDTAITPNSTSLLSKTSEIY